MIASLIARYEFSDPDQLIDILDSAGRPEAAVHGEQERKRIKKNFTIDCQAYRLDQTACWHDWVSALGVRVKGLRSLHESKYAYVNRTYLIASHSGTSHCSLDIICCFEDGVGEIIEFFV